MPFVLAAFAFAASLTAPASAQPPAEIYATAVRAYVAGGEVIEAMAPMQAWGRPEFQKAIDALRATRDGKTMEAAAVLQLEIALGEINRSPVMSQEHLELGESLVDWLRAAPADQLH